MAKQTSIPGTEEPAIPELDELADKYVKIRDRWMKLGGQLKEAGIVLLDAMKRHKRKKYVLDDGSDVLIEPGKDKVKVKSPKDEDGDE